MHDIRLAPDVEERARRRRSDAHPFRRFDPTSAALLVVDMQNGFVDPNYAGAVPEARSIVPNINRLASSMRRAGGTVVWIQNSASRTDLDGWDAVFDHFMTPEIRQDLVDSLTEGRPGFDLVPELEVHPSDLQVIKNRFSAFIQDASDIESRLGERGIDTVLITGTVTNVCCESTARDAAMRNFKVVMVADANAARSDEEHNASLNNLFNMFADVLTTEEIVGHLDTRFRPARRTA